MHSPQLRTTITVGKGKLPESIRFYQQILKYEVKLDVTLDASHGEADLLDMPGCKTRLVALGRPDATHGWIGLLEYLAPDGLTIRSFLRHPNEPFPVSFVFRTTDLDGLYDMVRAIGATVICPPRSVRYPGKAPAKGMTFLDPNGVKLTFTEFEDHLL